MGNEDRGESSRKSDTNDDERPLKKARYVWEVKGKYHLKENIKNNTPNNNNNIESNEADKENNEITSEITKEAPLNRVNNDKENNSSDRCCIESFLAKTEALMDSDDDEILARNIDQAISNEIPVTLVSPNPKNQDYYLRKWQARQIARGFVDNTINSVLETYMVPPFDAADFVENCENDGQVEDEGILMAIQSHGLQSNLRGNIRIEQRADRTIISKESFSRNQEIVESTLDNFENIHNELIKEGISSSTTNSRDSMSCDSLNQEIECNSNLQMADPMDFLSAAVTVAIQKKGLSSHGYS